MSESRSPEEAGRRSFLRAVIRASATIIGLITALPGIGMLLSPILAGSNRARRKVLFQQPSDAESPTFVAARFEGQEETAPGIFVRKVDGKPHVLSARCTHAGCAVTWKDDKREFFCACHNGYFDENGMVKSGPPPRPLDRIQTEEKGGDLYILEAEA